MECSGVRLMLDQYLKGELNAIEEKAVECHLQKCAGCFDYMNLLKELNEMLSMDPPILAKEGFTAGVMDIIYKESAREKNFLFPKLSLVNFAASMVLAGLLTIFINIPYVNGMVASWSDTVKYRAAAINSSINVTKEQVGEYFKNIIPGGK